MLLCRYFHPERRRPAIGVVREDGWFLSLDTDDEFFPDMDGWLARPDALAFAQSAASRALSSSSVSMGRLDLYGEAAAEPAQPQIRRFEVKRIEEARNPVPEATAEEQAKTVRRFDPAGTAPVITHILGETLIRSLAPIESQEVWGAGVTYERSKVARMEESASGGTFYDLVYTAARPELFFKATAARVSGPGEPIRIRRDSTWDVPEPELALVVSASGEIVGYTVGNDVSSRSIEGENPLYLPQAKVYDGCCALGPVIALAEEGLDPRAWTIRLRIRRGDGVAFEGGVSFGRMRRPLPELVEYLLRDNTLPAGAILLTGTGIVPPDEFSLQSGDRVEIAIDGIGTLANPVA